jgi:hypothetical protein
MMEFSQEQEELDQMPQHGAAVFEYSFVMPGAILGGARWVAQPGRIMLGRWSQA